MVPIEGINSIDILSRIVINKIQNEYIYESTAKPKKGDVIFCRRAISLYKHFCIYIGRGKVIHFAAKDGEADPEEAVIHETTLKRFANGDKVYVMNFPEEYHAGSKLRELAMKDGYCLQSPEETVARAKSKLGLRGVKDEGYSFFMNNCEDFAIWCKTNVCESRQLNSYIDAVLP